MPDDATTPADPAAATPAPQEPQPAQAPTTGSSDATASGGGAAGTTNPALTIPDEVRAQWPDLIELILKSESMNDEERQYWVNILPIMTPEQQQNLRDILVNERDQLAAIDAKYAKEIQAVGEEQFIKQVAEERRQKTEERTTAEQTTKAQEDANAEDLLKKMDTI